MGIDDPYKRKRRDESIEVSLKTYHSIDALHVNWVILPVVVGALILAVSCGHPSNIAVLRSPVETPLKPMLVADLGMDIIVEDFDAVLRQFNFVQEYGGHITAVRTDDQNGTERMIVEFRVPHENTASVAEILMTEFGEVTYMYVFSADVSVRNARLRRELSEQEEILGDRSGTELVDARNQIELLRDSIEFQQEREAFLFVMIHLVEAR